MGSPQPALKSSEKRVRGSTPKTLARRRVAVALAPPSFSEGARGLPGQAPKVRKLRSYRRPLGAAALGTGTVLSIRQMGNVPWRACVRLGEQPPRVSGLRGLALPWPVDPMGAAALFVSPPGAARVSWLPPVGVGLPQASQRRRALFPVEATSAGRHWGRQGSRRSRVASRRSDAERWLGRGGGRRATNGSYELEFGANGGSCCPALPNRPRRGCEASSRPEGIFGEGRTVIACSGRSRRGGCASPALPWPML